MRVTLRRFTKDPKRYLKKAPFIIVINAEPQFAVIPYVTYKATFEQGEKVEIHSNTVTNHMQSTPKRRGRLYRLFFE